jgi:hypothetical protein
MKVEGALTYVERIRNLDPVDAATPATARAAVVLRDEVIRLRRKLHEFGLTSNDINDTLTLVRPRRSVPPCGR